MEEEKSVDKIIGKAEKIVEEENSLDTSFFSIDSDKVMQEQVKNL